MKTCIFITGTNACGKTTLARNLIERYGGVHSFDKHKTLCRHGNISLAGPYREGSIYGGVDALNSTSMLASVVSECLTVADTVICEGMYLNTFGINLTNALFRAERQLVVFLYAPAKTIDERLGLRSGTRINRTIMTKQQQAARAAKKFASIGVPVWSFDTSVTHSEYIETKIAKWIQEK